MTDPTLKTFTRDQLYLKLKVIDPARANGKTRARREDLIRLITEAETVQTRKANVARAVVPVAALPTLSPEMFKKKRPSARAGKIVGQKLMGFPDHPPIAAKPEAEKPRPERDLAKTALMLQRQVTLDEADRLARVIRGIDIAMQVMRLTNGSLTQVATLLFAASGIAVEESLKVLHGLSTLNADLLKSKA